MKAGKKERKLTSPRFPGKKSFLRTVRRFRLRTRETKLFSIDEAFPQTHQRFRFKKIFGDENERDILISFLNAVLGFSGDGVIEEIGIANPNQVPKIRALKDTILDVKARDKKGRTFIVEMQVVPNHNFFKRSLYYTSQAYVNQISPGDSYGKLKKVYFVGVLDFSGLDGERYLSNHLILNRDTGENEIGDFEFCFVELPKFKKGIGELEGVVEKWVYFLKHAGECEKVPEEFLTEEVFARAFEIAKTSGWNAEELDLYERRQHFFREQEDLRKEGLEEGMEKGLEEGMEKGMEKGLEKGREEGEKTTLQRAVLGLHKNGIDARIIASSLRMDADEVLKIVSSIRKS